MCAAGSRLQLSSALSTCRDIWGLEVRQTPAGGAGEAAALLFQCSPGSEIKSP